MTFLYNMFEDMKFLIKVPFRAKYNGTTLFLQQMELKENSSSPVYNWVTPG